MKQTGLCYSKLDSLKPAAEYYEKSLTLNKTDINSALDLSSVYFKMEKYDSAFMTIYRVYDGINPTDPRLDKMLGEIFLKRKVYIFAEKYFKNALQLGDSSAIVLQKLGIATYFVGQYNSPLDSAVLEETFTDAVKYLERSYKKNKNDALTSVYLGLSYKELRQYKKAIKFIEEALSLAIPPYLSDVYNYLATCYELNEDYNKSIEIYNESLEFNPANKTIHYYLASIYDKHLKDRSAALMHYEKFLEANESDKLLKSYAETRAAKLKEELFFRNGSSQVK